MSTQTSSNTTAQDTTEIPEAPAASEPGAAVQVALEPGAAVQVALEPGTTAQVAGEIPAAQATLADSEAQTTLKPEVTAPAALEPGQSICGFTVLSAEPLAEIDGVAYQMRHEKSGARLLYLCNNDENMAFSISFKTPPTDATGVFHILEHSVLCGSERFPVKEPFVNLIKSSMQTFLNAMTFPDKTMYPVASTNEQDLLNLMDVYMDAVLNPAIYHKQAIFEQEGWHYEIDENDGSLHYNGVVYNEMKGALSDPDSVLYNALSAALFPDTCYRFESGGDPEKIPELAYESFLDTHARHYRLDNAYIVLYGAMHVERELEFLDSRYLSAAPQCDTPRYDAAQCDAAPKTAPKAAPNPLELQEPVVSLNAVKRMATAPENATAGLAYVVGQAHDRERIIASNVLIDALMGSNEAPLKKALLKAGIADDASGYLADSQLQPALIIQIKGCRADESGSYEQAAQALLEITERTARELVEKGIDRERIEACLARDEFALRERDYGTADGVVLSMSAMSGWLYNEASALDYLRFEDVFASLHQKLSEGYFEELLAEILLNNNHFARVLVEPIGEQNAQAGLADSETPDSTSDNTPDGTDAKTEAERLAQIRASMTDADIQTIIRKVATLREQQEAPDAPEDLAKLPLLSLDDIAQARSEAAYSLDDSTPLPCLYHSVSTRGIDYASVYYDMSRLRYEDLPYAMLLCMLLGRLPTKRHSAEELDKLIKIHLGSMRSFIDVFADDEDPSFVTPRLVIATSSLSEKISWAVELAREVRDESSFADRTRIRDILTQRRIGLEQSFANEGSSAALLRCSSYLSHSSQLRETLSGVDFYRFLTALLSNFDERFDELVAKLEEVASLIFVRNNAIASFTGPRKDYEEYWSHAQTMGLSTNATASRLRLPELSVKNEAFIVPSDVCFAARTMDGRAAGIAYEGGWHVAARALSYDYLWNEVRVKGGAYGTGFRVARSGLMQAYSYRDPNPDASLACFDASGSWLAAFSPDEAEMRGYIISSVAGHDAPVTPRALAHRQDSDWFCNRPADYRRISRNELLAATPMSLREHGSELERLKEPEVRCVFGNRALIEASKKEWHTIDLLGEKR